MKKVFGFALIGLVMALFFSFALRPVSAHEVYVLTEGQISYDLGHASPNPFTALEMPGTLKTVAEYAELFIVVVGILFWVSWIESFQKLCSHFLNIIRPYASTVARVFVGISLVFSGMHGALFGPELPLVMFGNFAPIISLLLFVLGILLVAGLFSRIAAFLAIALFCAAVLIQGNYMLTYFNYFAEFFLILLAGSGKIAIDNVFADFVDPEFSERFEKKYAGAILRIGFGIALLYAALYVKFFHAQLSLDVIGEYHLTRYFPYPPLLIVLGAGFVEGTIALLYIIGFEIRFNSIFFLSFVTLSVGFFGEAVWPHLVLYGIAVAIILYGYDRYSIIEPLRKKIARRRGQSDDAAEPVF